MTNPFNMSNSNYRSTKSLININTVSAGLTAVIHHVEERRERIMWTMGSPGSDRCVQCVVCSDCTETVHEYLGI